MGNLGTGATQRAIQAAQAMGGKAALYIILRHALARQLAMIISATLAVPGFIGGIGALSLIGLEFSSLTPLGKYAIAGKRSILRTAAVVNHAGDYPTC